MKHKRCPDCNALLSQANIDEGKCVKCGSDAILKIAKQKPKQVTKTFKPSLSEKYNQLNILKLVLRIFLVLSIGAGIIGVINISNMYGIGGAFFIYVLVWLMGLFGIYCSVSIIDFLFELDKTKSNK